MTQKKKSSSTTKYEHPWEKRMAAGTPQAVFWIEVINWDKWNPRKDVKKPSWFRMENDLLDGNPDFDDFTCEELVTWWWILSQCSRAQRGAIKCSLEKWERIRGIPVARSWVAVEKLLAMGTVHVTDASRGRDGDVTDAYRARDGRVSDASLSRHATNERTYDTDGRNEHEDPKSQKQKNLNLTELINKGGEQRVGDKSTISSENFGEAGEGKSNFLVSMIRGLISRGSTTTALTEISKLPVRDQVEFAEFISKHSGLGRAPAEGNA